MEMTKLKRDGNKKPEVVKMNIKINEACFVPERISKEFYTIPIRLSKNTWKIMKKAKAYYIIGLVQYDLVKASVCNQIAEQVHSENQIPPQKFKVDLFGEKYKMLITWHDASVTGNGEHIDSIPMATISLDKKLTGGN